MCLEEKLGRDKARSDCIYGDIIGSAGTSKCFGYTDLTAFCCGVMDMTVKRASFADDRGNEDNTAEIVGRIEEIGFGYGKG